MTDHEKIAVYNDLCRKSLGLHGLIVNSPGIYALPCVEQLRVYSKVAHYEHFTPFTDPKDERSSGGFNHQGIAVVWKIDYLSPDMNWKSDDPSDPVKTMRVLTIMLAEEC